MAADKKQLVFQLLRFGGGACGMTYCSHGCDGSFELADVGGGRLHEVKSQAFTLGKLPCCDSLEPAAGGCAYAELWAA